MIVSLNPDEIHISHIHIQIDTIMTIYLKNFVSFIYIQYLYKSSRRYITYDQLVTTQSKNLATKHTTKYNQVWTLPVGLQSSI